MTDLQWQQLVRKTKNDGSYPLLKGAINFFLRRNLNYRFDNFKKVNSMSTVEGWYKSYCQDKKLYALSYIY